MAAMSTCWLLATTRTRSHRFVLERGWASMISTVSPCCDSLFSSCTWQTVRRRRNLPYFGWRTSRSISTRRVFCILSPVTRPMICRLGMTQPTLLTRGRGRRRLLGALVVDRLRAGHQPAITPQLARRVESLGLRLNLQPEQMLDGVLERQPQLF